MGHDGWNTNRPPPHRKPADVARSAPGNALPLLPIPGTHAVGALAMQCGAGRRFSAVRTSCGNLFTFGNNADGELGIGEEAGPIRDPVQVFFPTMGRLAHISCGAFHMAAVSESGALYTWGANFDAQLGIGFSGGVVDIPTRVHLSLDEKEVSNECTEENDDGWFGGVDGDSEEWDVWASSGDEGEEEEDASEDGGERDQSDAHQAGEEVWAAPPGERFVYVACGQYHTAAITDDGRLYTFGSNFKGQLGIGKRAAGHYFCVPQLVSSISDPVIMVSCGWRYTAAVTAAGELYTWGYNYYSQLGVGKDKPEYDTPQRVDIPGGSRIVWVSCGYWSTAAVTVDGVVLTWGRNEEGQLGSMLGVAERERSRPLPVSLPGDRAAVQVECGRYHMGALTADGRLYVWGRNYSGILGLGRKKGGAGASYTEVVPPTRVPISRSTPIRGFACGENHTLAVGVGGELFAWGSHEYGQIGVGEKKRRKGLRAYARRKAKGKSGKILSPQRVEVPYAIEGVLVVEKQDAFPEGMAFDPRPLGAGVLAHVQQAQEVAVPLTIGSIVTVGAAMATLGIGLWWSNAHRTLPNLFRRH